MPVSLGNNASSKKEAMVAILASNISNSTTHPRIPLQGTVVLAVITMLLVRDRKTSYAQSMR